MRIMRASSRREPSSSPVRSRSVSRQRQTKAEVREDFVPRTSLLDDSTDPCDLIECERHEDWQTAALNVPFSRQPFSRQIQGWLHLFWFIIAIYVSSSWFDHYKATGSFYGSESWSLLKLAYRDWWELLRADFMLILYTFLSIPLQLLHTNGYLVYGTKLSWVLRHLFSISPITLAVWTSSKNDWPGLQIGTFLLHSIVLFMKCHSYLENNFILHADKTNSRRRRAKEGDYPRNVTVQNFAYYLLVPTLIYKPSYPRSKRIRLSFLFDRTVGAFVILMMIYANIDNYILPTLRNIDSIEFVECMKKLILPFSLNLLLLFFFVFEYLLHLFAEVTRFADRHFYEDWWNSLDQAEFSRKWNIPVHKFLQQHVYLACRKRHNFNKISAAFWTFLFSSILHEVVMSMSAKSLRWEFFCCQMLQIPLIWISSKVQPARFPKAANIFFWMSLFGGSTLLLVIYAKHSS